MVRKITILSLVILCSFSLFAQNVIIHKKSSSSIVTNKPNISPKKSYNGNPNGIQSLYYVLPSDNYYANGSYGPFAPTCYRKYERCVYLITAAEIAKLGIPGGVKVNQIAWTYYTPGGGASAGTLKVYLQNTSDATFTKSTNWATAVTSAMTLVDNNASFSLSSTAYSVIENFSLPTAFTYTGGGIYVAFDLANTSTNTTAQDINITSVAAGGGSVSLEMNQSASSAPNTMVTTYGAYRPETYLGFSIANDMEVMQVYTLGKLPIPYSAPHQISAVVSNNGSSTVHNVNVTLNITGANSHSEVVQIDSLQSGYYMEVPFSNWTPSNAGTDTVKVSVPSDDINSNNIKSVTQLITSNVYNYAYGPFPPTADGGVGFTGASGDFAAKYHSGSAASIDQVAVNFSTAGQPYQVGIWDATGTGGTPGTLLWQSASLTAVAGITNITVSPKVHVNGDFFVGIRQTGTTNVSMGYQVESPIRAGAFYLATPTGSTTWYDFATGNDFRLMIEPILTLNDVGVASIDFPVGGSNNNITANIAPKATITNYGAANQSSAFNVTMDILNSGGVKIYTSTKSITLNSGASQQVTFDASFNPSAGTYGANCYTSLGTDVDSTNNLKSCSFNYSQFSLNLTALIQGLFNGVSMVSDTVTVELRDTTAPYPLQASKKVVLNTSGNGTVSFTTPLNSISHYFIVIKHRNAVETWSAAGNIFNSSAMSYNFTTAANLAYGSNLILNGGKYCIYSGDVNHDGLVDLSDLIEIDNDNANYVSGFSYTDVDGNNLVDLSDLVIVDNNNAAYVSRQVPPGAPESKASVVPIIK